MNGRKTSRTRLPLRLGGVMALVAGLWTMAPSSTAHAADAGAGVSDRELVQVHDRWEARRQASARILAVRLTEALGESAERAEQVRERLENWVTWGYGFDALVALDTEAVAEAEQVEEPEPEPAEPAEPRRFEYSTDTSDPLAGLF